VSKWPPKDPTADDIRATRLRANLSQRELAMVLALSFGGRSPTTNTVARWEQGYYTPRGIYKVVLRKWMRRYPPPVGVSAFDHID
jgi:DNA-binding transcriptional regulator YiaG